MQPSARSERLDIRISPQAKRWLIAAAEAQHKSLSEFVLDTAITKAETVLAERRVFSLSADAWDAFQAALDAPPQSYPRLKKLLNTPSVFD
ncbi:MAG: DUF1778 domain-containing protein [Symploca sp. SIO1B1]|nr:DUF1778 domain-containing protein [Symploca sp. SIO1B1]